MNIYVGNLNYKVSENDLKNVFGEYGDINSVKIIIDRQTGRSKGYAFVEMTESSDADRAIEELNGAEFMSRVMVVNKAQLKPKEQNNFNKR